MTEYVEFDGKNIAETDEAVLYSNEDDMEEWVPKSLMIEWPEHNETGIFVMQEWIAIDKELI